MRAIFPGLMIFLLVSPVGAKPWHHDRKWWIGESVVIGAATLDYVSTGAYQRTCPMCGDTNPLIPKHAPMGQLVGVYLLDLGIETTLYALEHHFSQGEGKGWEIVGYTAFPAVSASGHIYGAVSNWELVRDCREARLVCH